MRKVVLIMAIDINGMLAEELLELCKHKPLASITIKEMIDRTGISRQTFYNHFIDKNDFLHYVYDTKIVHDFRSQNKNIKFYDSLLRSFKNMEKYHTFMKQACMMNEQNCLKDYIFEHCKDFDLKWHQELYGSKPMSEALTFATIYHATASSSMTLSWILSDMPVSCEEIAKMIVEMRGIGMDVLFKEGESNKNPYQ